MARKARRRVEEHFSWTSIARQTLEFYETLVSGRSGERSRQRGGDS
jgi:glycosyltransferase involved in cell wall biosynthesis